MKEILEAINKTKFELGAEDALVELTNYGPELAKIQGADWVAFKAKLKKIIKVSEADLKELRQVKTVAQGGNEWTLYLDHNKQGEILSGLKNCSTLLAKHPEVMGGIGFNDFLQRPCFTQDMPFMPDIKIKEGDFVEFDDTKLAQVSVWMAHNATEFTDGNIIKSVVNQALTNRFNPLARRLIKCWESWDKKPRLDNWLFDYLDAQCHEGIDEQLEKDYISRVGSMWMISAIARVFDAGCKVDTMLILEGKQGEGKSQFLEDLSFGYFVDLTTNLSRSKEVVDQLFGKWIVELPELKALSRDQNANKAFLTRRKDTERLSYARFSKDFPRRCVFIGTTNDDQYLTDLTGNRRFWPVKVGEANREKLKIDINHLWAEAVDRFMNGVPWWFDNNKDAAMITVSKQIQGLKLDEDDLVSSLEHYLKDMNFTTTEKIWSDFIGGDRARLGKAEQMRVAGLIKSCGWVRGKKNGRKGWKIGVPPEVPPITEVGRA